MTMPLMRPKRKNPVLRTRQMNVPPGARPRRAGPDRAAAKAASSCRSARTAAPCSTRRARPAACVSHRLQWRAQSGDGRLLALTTLHHSNELFFRERLPWRLGLVHLDAGPTMSWPTCMAT
jgi:hypothetical protein